MSVSDKKYITLQEATKFCPYSQHYLSLRARQGKLRAIKLGRNWVTTEEWLKKYINSFASQTKPGALMEQPEESLVLETKDSGLEKDFSSPNFVKTHSLSQPNSRKIGVWRLFFIIIAGIALFSLFSQNIVGSRQFFLNKFKQIKQISGSLTRDYPKESTEETAEKELEQAFSDEIEVKEVSESGNSGIFVPIFGGSEGPKYLFQRGFSIIPLEESAQ